MIEQMISAPDLPRKAGTLAALSGGGAVGTCPID